MRPLDRSVQYVRQPWLWALLLVGSVPAWLLATVAIVAESPEPWTAQLPVLGLVTLAVFAPLPLVWRANLAVAVREDSLAIRFWPLHLRWRVVPCDAIERVEATHVSAFGDFGGVGVRYNVSLSRSGLVRRGPKGYVTGSGPSLRIERRAARDLVVTVDDPERVLASLERACGSGGRSTRDGAEDRWTPRETAGTSEDG